MPCGPPFSKFLTVNSYRGKLTSQYGDRNKIKTIVIKLER